MASESAEPIERWTVKRCVAVDEAGPLGEHREAKN